MFCTYTTISRLLRRLKLFKNTCNFQLKCHLDTDSLVKSDLSLKFSLETNAVSIRKNNGPENPDLNLASRLEMNAMFVVENKTHAMHL